MKSVWLEIKDHNEYDFINEEGCFAIIVILIISLTLCPELTTSINEGLELSRHGSETSWASKDDGVIFWEFTHRGLQRCSLNDVLQQY